MLSVAWFDVRVVQDTFAKALLAAAKMHEDKVFSKMVEKVRCHRPIALACVGPFTCEPGIASRASRRHVRLLQRVLVVVYSTVAQPRQCVRPFRRFVTALRIVGLGARKENRGEQVHVRRAREGWTLPPPALCIAHCAGKRPLKMTSYAVYIPIMS